ncbi:hypothetical protein [Nocardia yunnanensis]|uniref:hypothetical protein n=1 Tax=Nocardia yunnanensis TaxID=2382165 RepID=UPI0013C4B6EF|nr:hypothetical protein [Nocardia yunnanensis]
MALARRWRRRSAGAFTAISGHYDALHTHAHNGANTYVETEDVSVDKFTNLGDAV